MHTRTSSSWPLSVSPLAVFIRWRVILVLVVPIIIIIIATTAITTTSALVLSVISLCAVPALLAPELLLRLPLRKLNVVAVSRDSRAGASLPDNGSRRFAFQPWTQ